MSVHSGKNIFEPTQINRDVQIFSLQTSKAFIVLIPSVFFADLNLFFTDINHFLSLVKYFTLHKLPDKLKDEVKTIHRI